MVRLEAGFEERGDLGQMAWLDGDVRLNPEMQGFVEKARGSRGLFEDLRGSGRAKTGCLGPRSAEIRRRRVVAIERDVRASGAATWRRTAVPFLR